MSKSIQIIFGSLDFLKAYQARLRQPLMLLRPLTGGSFALLDPSGGAKFALPRRYRFLAASGKFFEQGFLTFQYFQLSPEEAPVFVDAAKRIVEKQATITNNYGAYVLAATPKVTEYALLTHWATTTAEAAAQKTPAFDAIATFARRAATGAGYHEATYQVVTEAN